MQGPAYFVPLAMVLSFEANAHAELPGNAPSTAAPATQPDAAVRTTGHSVVRTDGHSGAAPPPTPAKAPPPTPAEAPPPAPEPGHDPNDARFTDAHFDRVITMPTAETHPDGTLYFSSYDIVVLQAGYAVSDRTQVTLTGTPPFGDDGDYVFLLDGTLKTVLARERRFRIAALGSVSGIAGLEEGNFFVGRAGGVAQFCLEPLCRTSLNMATHVLLGGPATMNLTGAGGVWRVSTAVSLLFEANVLVPFGREVGRVNGLALGPGIRFGWKSFAIDLAVEWVADAEVDEDESLPALPLLAVTYRVWP